MGIKIHSVNCQMVTHMYTCHSQGTQEDTHPHDVALVMSSDGILLLAVRRHQ